MNNVQRCPKVEILSIGQDLSVCIADLRSYRSNNGFLPATDFRKLVAWARGLSCPGVLAIPQPLIVQPNDAERNLLSWGDQYKELLEAHEEHCYAIPTIGGVRSLNLANAVAVVLYEAYRQLGAFAALHPGQPARS